MVMTVAILSHISLVRDVTHAMSKLLVYFHKVIYILPFIYLSVCHRTYIHQPFSRSIAIFLLVLSVFFNLSVL
jgi:hypothetical protein